MTGPAPFSAPRTSEEEATVAGDRAPEERRRALHETPPRSPRSSLLRSVTSASSDADPPCGRAARPGAASAQGRDSPRASFRSTGRPIEDRLLDQRPPLLDLLHHLLAVNSCCACAMPDRRSSASGFSRKWASITAVASGSTRLSLAPRASSCDTTRARRPCFQGFVRHTASARADSGLPFRRPGFLFSQRPERVFHAFSRVNQRGRGGTLQHRKLRSRCGLSPGENKIFLIVARGPRAREPPTRSVLPESGVRHTWD